MRARPPGARLDRPPCDTPGLLLLLLLLAIYLIRFTGHAKDYACRKTTGSPYRSPVTR